VQENESYDIKIKEKAWLLAVPIVSSDTFFSFSYNLEATEIDYFI